MKVRRIATAAVIVSMTGQSFAEEGFYYRRNLGEGAAAAAAASQNLPPTPSGNSVRGDGDLALYAADNARGRPGVLFRFPVVATDAVGPLSFSSVGGPLPAGLYLSPNGVISGDPTQTGTFQGILVAGAESGGRRGVTKPIAIDVVPRPVIGLPGSFAVAAGTAANLVPTVANALGSQTWSISGMLPSGLSFDGATGTISGSTDQAGSFPGLVLTVVDSDGAKGQSAPFALNVTSTITVGGIQPAYAARLGAPFQGVQPSISGTRNPVRWGMATGILPAGLRLDSATGTVSGTPTAKVNVTGLSLRATDTVTGATVSSQSFSVAVGTEPVVTLAQTAFFGRVGNSVTVVPTATGLLGDARWFLEGPLPDGLELNTGYGRLAGILGQRAAGTFDGLRLRVVDLYDGSSSYSPTFSVSGKAKPSLAAMPSAVAEVNLPFAIPAPSAANVIGTPTWTLSGDLPAGLTFDPATGAIGGTPTAVTAQPSTLTVLLRDSFDAVAADPVSFTLRVVPKGALAVAGVSSAYRAYVGRAFALRPGVAGATGAVSWRAPYLPSWVVLDEATGAMTGVPQVPEASGSLQVTATDAAGKSASTPVFTLDALRPLSLRYEQVTATQGQPFALAPTVADAQGTPRYVINGGKLPEGVTFDTTSGVVSGTTFRNGVYPIQVTATDAAVSSDPAYVGIQVLPSPWSAVIPPNPAGKPNYPFSVTPTAAGFSGAVAWSLVSGVLPSWATLDPSTGTIAGTPSGVSYGGPYVLEARSGTERARTGAFYVAVTRDPTLSAAVTPVQGYVGALMRVVPTSTNSQGNLRWSLTQGTLPDGLMLDQDQGVISGVPGAPGDTAGLVLTVADASGASASTTPFTLRIGDSPVQMGGIPDLSGQLGSPLRQDPIPVYGATGGQSFSLAAGTLPSWASVAPGTGRILGTPTGAAAVATTRDLRIQVVDGLGFSRLSNPFAIAVSRATLTASVPAVRTHYGVNYATPAAGAGNALGALTWSAQALPAGLSLNPATGAVTGTAAQPASVGTITFGVTDAYDGAVASTQSQVEVLGPPTVSVPAVYNARQNFGFGVTPGAASYIAPLRWSLTSGVLPSGLTLDAATGQIRGTPTAMGRTNGIVVSVTDAQNVSGSSSPFAFDVSDHLAVSIEQGSYGGRVGVPFGTKPPVVSGAVGAVSFALASGSLPDGLSVIPGSGAVGGVPNEAGTFTVTVSATDSSGSTQVSPSFTVAIGPAPTVTLADKSVRVGAPFEANPAATNLGYGENRVPVFSVSGTLPRWASFDPRTGQIAGTPDAVGSYPGLVVTVVDGQGATGSSQPFTLTVTPGISVTGLQASYAGRADSTLSPSVLPGLSNLRGTAAWSSRNLPAGLDLNGSTGAVTGKPSAGFSGTATLVVEDSFDRARTQAPVTFAISPKLQVMGAAGLTTHVGADAVAPAPSVVGQRGASLSWTSVGTTLPPWASLDAATGMVSVRNPPMPGASGIVVRAEDALDHVTADSQPFSLSVLPLPVVADVATSYTARFGFSYATSKPTLRNAIGSVAWTLDSGTLPSWAHLNQDGTISGVYPDKVAVTEGITLRGTDATGASDRSVPFSIGVYAQPAITISSVSPAGGKLRVGDAYEVRARVDGVVGAAAWSAVAREGFDAIPAGLSVPDPTVGVLSGTAGNAAATAFSLRVRDGSDGTAVFSDPTYLTVKPALAVSGLQDLVVRANTPRSATSAAPVATGVVQPGSQTYALDKPVPAGMNAFGYSAPGVLSGIPTQPMPATPYVVTMRDPWDGRTATGSFNVTVLGDLAFSTQPSDVSATIGRTSTMRPAVANATGAVAYVLMKGQSDVSDTLATTCPGLAFSKSDGSVSGTPTAICSVPNLSLRATDPDGAVAYSTAFTVSSASALAFANQPADFSVRQGGTGTGTASVTGSPFGAVTYSVVDAAGATAPAWLTVACPGGTCTVTASPGAGQATGIYPATGTYRLKAVDAAGTTANSNGFKVTVATQAVAATAPATTYAAVTGGQFTTGALSVTGGKAPYVYALEVQTGTKPTTTGAIATNGSFSFTPSAVGTWTYRIRVTDGTDATNTAVTQTVTVNVATPQVTTTAGDFTVYEGDRISYAMQTNIPSPTWSVIQTGSNATTWLTVDASGNVSGNVPDITSNTVYTYQVAVTSGGVTTRGPVQKVTAQAATATLSNLAPTALRSGRPATAALVTNVAGTVAWTGKAVATSGGQTVTDVAFAVNGSAVSVTGTNTGTTANARTLTMTATSGNVPTTGTAATATSAGVAFTVYPALAIAAPANQIFPLGSDANFQPSAAGVSNTSGGLWTLYDASNQNVGSSLGSYCPGLSFSSSTGSITGRPSGNCALQGLYLTVYDAGNNSAALQGTATSSSFNVNAALYGQAFLFTKTGSVSFTLPKPGLNVRILAVGGGAGGILVRSGQNAPGSGSGQVAYQTMTNAPASITINVGAGGQAAYGDYGYSYPGATTTVTVGAQTIVASGGSGVNGGSGASSGTTTGGSGGANGNVGTGQGTTSQGWSSFGSFKSAVVTAGSGAVWGWPASYAAGGDHVGGCGGGGVNFANVQYAAGQTAVSSPGGGSGFGGVACGGSSGFGGGASSTAAGINYNATYSSSAGMSGAVLVEWDAE